MRQKISTIIVALCVIITPLLVIAIRSISVHNNVLLGRPVWSDELLYWREIFSFSKSSFNIGYTEGWLGPGYEAKLGPLGCHGIAPIVAWGWYAFFFTIRDNSLVVANTIMLMCSLLIFVICVRPTMRKSIWVIILVMTYVPLISYIPTSMMELPCYAGIIVYIGLLINYQQKPKKEILVLLLSVVLYCSLLRICYAVLFFPLIALSFDKHKCTGRVLLQGGLTCVFTFGVRYLSSLFSSYWPYGFKWKFVLDFGEAPAWRIYLHHGKENFINWFNPYSDNLQQALQRYLLILLIIILLVRWLKEKKWIYLGGACSLGTLWAAIVMLYDVWDARDYRTQAPVTFGMLLWLIMTEKEKKDWQFWDKRIVYAVCTVPVLFSVYFATEGWAERYENVSELNVDWTELLDNDNAPCTIGMWEADNWNYSLIKSLPPEVGYSIVGMEVDINSVDTADFIITNSDRTDEITEFEYVQTVEEIGQLWKRKDK